MAGLEMMRLQRAPAADGSIMLQLRAGLVLLPLLLTLASGNYFGTSRQPNDQCFCKVILTIQGMRSVCLLFCVFIGAAFIAVDHNL